MSKTEDAHIGINRARIKIMGALYFALAFAFFLGFYFIGNSLDGGWAMALKITGGMIALFLLMTAASAMSVLNKKDAGIQFNANGIIDQSTQISAGLIEWKAVSAIETNASKKMILVFVKKPEVFIKNAKNRAVKQLYERNMQLYKTPLIIEAGYLDVSFDELKKLAEEYWKRFGKK
jgi:hypothetical protein